MGFIVTMFGNEGYPTFIDEHLLKMKELKTKKMPSSQMKAQSLGKGM